MIKRWGLLFLVLALSPGFGADPLTPEKIKYIENRGKDFFNGKSILLRQDLPAGPENRILFNSVARWEIAAQKKIPFMKVSPVDVQKVTEISRDQFNEFMKFNVDKYYRPTKGPVVVEASKEPPPKAARKPTPEPPERGSYHGIDDDGRWVKYPGYIPAWFKMLDQNPRDGQVGLYEWRKAGLETKHFQILDFSGDGLLTPEEFKKFSENNSQKQRKAHYAEVYKAVGIQADDEHVQKLFARLEKQFPGPATKKPEDKMRR